MDRMNAYGPHVHRCSLFSMFSRSRMDPLLGSLGVPLSRPTSRGSGRALHCKPACRSGRSALVVPPRLRAFHYERSRGPHVRTESSRHLPCTVQVHAKVPRRQCTTPFYPVKDQWCKVSVSDHHEVASCIHDRAFVSNCTPPSAVDPAAACLSGVRHRTSRGCRSFCGGLAA